MALAIALLCSAGAWAQTDVTSTYITNADFEGSVTSYSKPSADRDIYQPDGWSVSYTNGESNDLTSLNSETTQWNQFSGKPQPTNGGTKAYWMRFRWGSSENITLSQETSDKLPAGTYCLSVEAYSDDNTGTVTISAAGVSQTIRANSVWANYKVVFTLASAQNVTVSLSYTNTKADDHAAAFDNVKILNLTEEPTGIALKNELGGTAANLSDFNVWYNDYTLEVVGTAGTEITVAADNISYTPEATGAVRFVKKDGVVYVFEGTSYKTAVHSSKADYIYSRTLSKDDPITNNYLDNPSFETTGNFISGSKYKIGEPWTTNYTGSDIRIDKGTKSGIHGTCVLVWRGSGSGKDWYLSQQVTSFPKYKGVKLFAQQIDGGNANAKFNVGVGNAAGDYSYLSTQWTLGSGKNGTYNAELGYNESMATGNFYFTFRNTSNNTSSSGSDPVTQIDWIGLVGSDDFPITGVSSASYVYGTAYAPATAKASYLAAKAEAEETIGDATYNNVTGDERSNLQTLIDADVEDNDAAYNTATENIQAAQDAFTAALTHYQALIDAQAAVPDLAYASAAASAFKTAVATSASDADEKVAAMTTDIRAYYESHALAEGDATTVDYTSLLKNYNNPSNTSGWTINNTTGNSNMRIMSNESYTDADGTNNHRYFDSNSWGTAFAASFTQDVALTAGDYLFTVKARGNGTTTYKIIAGDQETDISAHGSTGGVFGRGWDDYSVEFTVAEDGNVTLGMQMETGASSNWLSFGNFRLMKMNNTLADATDYSNLNDAITAAEAHTLGFEVGEYAPQNNLVALNALAAAKAINPGVNNEQDVVQAATTALNDAEWTINETKVTNIIYNGMFSIQDGDDTQALGWTRTNGWGQMQSGIAGDYSTAYYNQPGSLQYGNNGIYTLPLHSNPSFTGYVVRVTYRSHENNSNKGITISVYNQDTDEYPLPAETFSANGSTSEWKTVEASFRVENGKAGNHILTIANDGNTWITNVEMRSFYNASQPSTSSTYDASFFDEIGLGGEYIEGRYPAAHIGRTFSDNGTGRWYSFVAPFDITLEELQANFAPSKYEFKVAEYAGDSGDENNVTVTFNTKESGTISANTPVLIYFKKKSPKFYDITELEFDSPKHTYIVDEAKVEGTYFDFVGVYDFADYDVGVDEDFVPFTIPAGDYFIGNGALYKSAGATTIKPFRAYLKAKGEPAAVKLFIDDLETSIEEVQGLELKAQNSEIYNLAGQKMSKLQKGVNIVNGKKVLVK